MASSEHIKALLLSHLERDEDRFLSIALQVATHEARSGHGKIAQELREIVEKARKPAKTGGAVPIAKGLKDGGGLLFATSPKLRLDDLIVPDEVKRRLERVIPANDRTGRFQQRHRLRDQPGRSARPRAVPPV